MILCTKKLMTCFVECICCEYFVFFVLILCVDSTLTSPVPANTVSSATVISATVGSNPFAVGGIYPAMQPIQASPQYMLVQTGSGPCYVPVTYGAFGTTVMSAPPVFSPPAAAQFQLVNPQQQQAPFAVHGQMHPANPFLVINF